MDKKDVFKTKRKNNTQHGDEKPKLWRNFIKRENEDSLNCEVFYRYSDKRPLYKTFPTFS